MRALLDVNVLIALLDVQHMHHDNARSWLRENIQHGWATCPITQNGCLRIMAQPGYLNSRPTQAVARRLSEAIVAGYHQFWPDDMSLLDSGVVDWRLIVGPKQITDVYLLALATTRQGRFVTFDSRIVPDAVVGARDRNYCVI